MLGSEQTAKTEMLRAITASHDGTPCPAWPDAVRSSWLLVPGKYLFLLMRDGAEVRLWSVARWAKDLPEDFPGERLRLAKSGAAIFSALDRPTAGALRSLLQLPAPGCLKEEGGEAVLLCRSGLAASDAEAARTVAQTGLVPCWLGGSAEEAFWSAFAAGWRKPFFRCGMLAKAERRSERVLPLTERYAGRTFVLNGGSVVRMPDKIGFGLPEGLSRAEAVGAGSAAEVLILIREAVQAGARPGLTVLKCSSPVEEELCRSAAQSYGTGRLAVGLARWLTLRQAGNHTAGCDLREYSFADAAEQIKDVVKKTI